MFLTIQVSLFRERGMAGAEPIVGTSSFEFDFDGLLGPSQQERLHHRIRQAFLVCAQRLAHVMGSREMEHRTFQDGPHEGDRTGAPIQDGSSRVNNCQVPTATQRQIRALYGMTVRHRMDLRRLLYDRFCKRHLYELTAKEAGCLIGELQRLEGAARTRQSSQ